MDKLLDKIDVLIDKMTDIFEKQVELFSESPVRTTIKAVIIIWLAKKAYNFIKK